MSHVFVDLVGRAHGELTPTTAILRFCFCYGQLVGFKATSCVSAITYGLMKQSSTQPTILPHFDAVYCA